MESLASNQTNGQALPESVKYARLPAKAIAGSANLRRYASSNGTAFDPVNNSIIRIPVTASGVNSFLDGHNGYISMKLSAAGKATNEAQKIDGGVFSLIQRLRIISRGNGAILEDVNNYNLIHNMLYCYQTDEGGMKISSATAGTSHNLMGDGADPSAAGYETVYNSTEGLGFAGNTAASDLTLTTPLVSGFLNNTKGLAIPLGASQGIEIEITLAPALECMVSTTECAYSVLSCHYFAPVFTVEGEGFQSSMAQMLSAMGGLSMIGDTFENFVASMTATAGEKLVNIPVQARSLKSIFTMARTTSTIQSITVSGLNLLLPNVITEFSYLIGSERYPPSRIQVAIATTDALNIGAAYASVQSALGQNNSLHARSLIGATDFSSDHFVHAVDVEKFQNQTGAISHTGINTLDGNLQVSLEVSNTPAAAQRTDSYCLKQVTYYLDLNGAFSVSR